MTYDGIAISGKAGAGKDTFGRELMDELARRGIWSTRVGFADAVKEELWRVYGLTKADPEGREKLLEIGHGYRQREPDIWVKRLAQSLDSLSPYGFVPVICDLRYPNEYEWARRSNILVVRVDALRMDRMVALSGRGEDSGFVDSEHESEVALDDESFDVRFWNPHSLASSVLYKVAVDVADLFDGTVERVAA